MEIFKYISNRDIDILIESIFKNNLLKFTQPKDFNDPFEIRPHIKSLASNDFVEQSINKQFESILVDELKKIGKESYINELNLEEIKKNTLSQITPFLQSNGFKGTLNNTLYEKNNDLLGILSLTTKNDNLLMWSHYANSHKGFVIEFNHENKFFNQKVNDEDTLRHLKEVKYTTTRPSQNLVDFDDNIDALYFTKSEEWSYEDEYRMILPLNNSSVQQNGMYLFKFPPQAIKALYLGVNMDSDEKIKLIKAIKSIQDLRHVELHQGVLSQTHYKIEFTKLDLERIL